MNKLFKKPTEQEVTDLFINKGVKDPKQPLIFFAHYETVGWYVGKRKMVSWRGAVAKWVLRMDDFKSNQVPPIKPMDTSGKSDQQKQEEQNQIKLAYKNQMK